MTSLMALLVIIFLGVMGREQGWFAAQAEMSGDAGSDQETKNSKDKVDQAFESLNKNIGGKETPILVEADAVQLGTLIQRVSAQGRAFGYQQMDIVNEVGGRLVKLHVHDGMQVKAGQVLAEIDDREYRLTFEEKESRYLAQKAKYLADYGAMDRMASAANPTQTKEQLERLRQEGIISEDDYRNEKLMAEMAEILSGNRRKDVIAAEYLDQAKLDLERAKLNLEKTLVRAPYDGVIFSVEVTAGQLLNSNTKLARLVNLDNLVVKAKVLESELGKITLGKPATVYFPALGDMGKLEGKVEAISPFVNEEDKTVETIIRFFNGDGRVRPGLFAEVTIDAKAFENVLMVPKTAILPRDERKVVFRISEESRAKWEYVETGVENEAFVQITQGKLNEGDMVLTNNHFTMGHDTLVKVAKSSDSDD